MWHTILCQSVYTLKTVFLWWFKSVAFRTPTSSILFSKSTVKCRTYKTGFLFEWKNAYKNYSDQINHQMQNKKHF